METPTIELSSAPAQGSPQGLPIAAPHLTLDTLAELPGHVLAQLFRSGTAGSLDELRGHPRGRMLAVPGFSWAPVAALLRWYAASPLIVWEGKSFTSAAGASEGRGFNRVRWFGRRRAFPFRTFAGDSLVDGRPCLAIAYDVPEIPRFARGTYDELRLVGDGLYLGRGMRRRRAGEPKLLVWFALDARRQDPDVP